VRYLVLSDVHANLPALEAVVKHATTKGFDDVMFLGDAVGYYPHAEEVVQRLIQLNPSVRILGNHDSALLELAFGERGEYWAAGVVMEVIDRQLTTLSSDSIAFLQTLQGGAEGDGWQAAHGALSRPWDYLATMGAAQDNVRLMHQPLLLVGHTHVPKLFACVGREGHDLWRTLPFREEAGGYRLPPRARVIANPGSVGQPRDQVPLASYFIYDAGARRVHHFRVGFDVASVQADIRAAGYPEVLATRLAAGR
jgi:predicted phosphodiesterase